MKDKEINIEKILRKEAFLFGTIKDVIPLIGDLHYWHRLDKITHSRESKIIVKPFMQISFMAFKYGLFPYMIYETYKPLQTLYNILLR